MSAEPPAHSPLATRMGHQLALTRDEAEFLASVPTEHLSVRPRTEILAAGERCRWLFLALDGWSYRQRLLEDGRRQIVQFILPGDMIGLDSLHRDEMACSVITLTAASFARVESRFVAEMRQRFPRLAELLDRFVAREHAMLVEQVVRLGSQTAYERVAHLLLELSDRLCAAGFPARESFTLPATQEDLADDLGLSLVHMNRTLQRLRREDLIRLVGQRVTLLDRERLVGIAGYRPAYLGKDGFARSRASLPAES